RDWSSDVCSSDLCALRPSSSRGRAQPCQLLRLQAARWHLHSLARSTASATPVDLCAASRRASTPRAGAARTTAPAATGSPSSRTRQRPRRNGARRRGGEMSVVEIAFRGSERHMQGLALEAGVRGAAGLPLLGAPLQQLDKRTVTLRLLIEGVADDHGRFLAAVDEDRRLIAEAGARDDLTEDVTGFGDLGAVLGGGRGHGNSVADLSHHTPQRLRFLSYDGYERGGRDKPP